MEAVKGDWSVLTLKESKGNKIQLLDKIQDEVHYAISTLRSSERDIVAVKNEVLPILERIYEGLDLIKASVKEEGSTHFVPLHMSLCRVRVVVELIFI